MIRKTFYRFLAFSILVGLPVGGLFVGAYAAGLRTEILWVLGTMAFCGFPMLAFFAGAFFSSALMRRGGELATPGAVAALANDTERWRTARGMASSIREIYQGGEVIDQPMAVRPVEGYIPQLQSFE